MICVVTGKTMESRNGLWMIQSYQQTFPVKDQTVSILGFVSYLVSVTTSQLHSCGTKAALDKEWAWLCSDKTVFAKTGSGPDLVQEMLFGDPRYKGHLEFKMSDRFWEWSLKFYLGAYPFLRSVSKPATYDVPFESSCILCLWASPITLDSLMLSDQVRTLYWIFVLQAYLNPDL